MRVGDAFVSRKRLTEDEKFRRTAPLDRYVGCMDSFRNMSGDVGASPVVDMEGGVTDAEGPRREGKRRYHVMLAALVVREAGEGWLERLVIAPGLSVMESAIHTG